MRKLVRFLMTTAVAALSIAAYGLASPLPAYAGGGCHYSAPTDGAGTTVAITDECFQPNILHVKVGDTVTWTNKEDTLHTVTGTAESFGTYDNLRQGQAVSYRFAQDGVYPYFCLLHPGMAAAIVVGSGTGSGPAAMGSAVKQIPASPAATAAPVSQPAAARATDGIMPWGLLGIAGLAVGLPAGLVVGGRLRRTD